MRVLQEQDLFQRPVKDSEYHSTQVESVKSVDEYIFVRTRVVEKT